MYDPVQKRLSVSMGRKEVSNRHFHELLLYLDPFPCQYRVSHQRRQVAKTFSIIFSITTKYVQEIFLNTKKRTSFFLETLYVRVYNTYFSASSNKILKQDFLGSKILNFETGRFDPGWITFVFKPGNELYYYALKNCKIPPGESEKE